MDIPRRGPFPFGPPYETLGIRVTNEDDGEILPRTYAYWPNVNAHLGRDTTARVPGDQPRAVSVGRGQVFPRGDAARADLPRRPSAGGSTAEGWYWDARDPHVLYCSDDKHLYRYNVETHELVTVVDVTPLAWLGEFALRQWHTSSSARIRPR